MMEGLSLAYFIIYKRGGSFSHDLVHIIGWIHSIMDSCYHGIQSVIDLIQFVIAINILNEIILFLLLLF